MDQRFDRSLDNLLTIIAENTEQIIFLSSLVHQLAKGVTGVSPEVNCSVIKDPQYIHDHLATTDCDYLILVIPDAQPKGLDREAIDRMLENGELAAWIDANWAPGTMAITAP